MAANVYVTNRNTGTPFKQFAASNGNSFTWTIHNKTTPRLDCHMDQTTKATETESTWPLVGLLSLQVFVVKD